MKKYLYLSFAAIAALQVNAQITLTQANNAPASGDVQSTKLLDSTAALDKSSGASKTWNYSTSVTNSTNNAVSTVSYTTASSVPGASMFVSAGANVAAKDSSEFYKSTSTSLEMLGSMGADGSVMYFSNSMKVMQFPFSYSNSFTDTYSGTMNIPSYGTFNINGNLSVNADGYGTVILPSTPGNLSFSNVLRVRMNNTMTIAGTGTLALFTGTITSTQYMYFKSGTKNPFFSITYQRSNIPPSGPQDNASISYDAVLPVSVQEIGNNTPALFIYPNPSKDELNIQMNKTDYKTGKIIDTQGKSVMEFSINQNSDTETINIKHLSKGVYIIQLDGSVSGCSAVSYRFIKE